jgi:SAM domain (Sterile alpha motif)
VSAPTPQPIADWLEKLGLGQHAQRFAENEIDVSVLRHLTDQDLKDIGVPLGASAENAASHCAVFWCRSGTAAASIATPPY